LPRQNGWNWSETGPGWTLQAQTNPWTVELGTNWVSLTGSLTANMFVAPIDPSNGSVFYRLKHP
jgi:hypothetical protein